MYWAGDGDPEVHINTYHYKKGEVSFKALNREAIYLYFCYTSFKFQNIVIVKPVHFVFSLHHIFFFEYISQLNYNLEIRYEAQF